jgi:hypothetical protein
MPHTTYDVRNHAMAEAIYQKALADSPAKGPGISTRSERDRSTLDDVYGALAEANALASRVKAIVERLCGSTPEAEGKGTDGEPFGIFPTLRRCSGDTLELVRQAQSALNRLDRELP